MTYLDLNLRLPELLLMRLDKMGMGVSLETRVPFLDHKFVELAMSIPEQVITRGNESKHILKKAVRGLIPDDIIDRKKQGFGVPIYEWFFEEFGEFARRELSDFCNKTDFLNQLCGNEPDPIRPRTRRLVPAELCSLVEGIHLRRGAFHGSHDGSVGCHSVVSIRRWNLYAECIPCAIARNHRVRGNAHALDSRILARRALRDIRVSDCRSDHILWDSA